MASTSVKKIFCTLSAETRSEVRFSNGRTATVRTAARSMFGCRYCVPAVRQPATDRPKQAIHSPVFIPVIGAPCTSQGQDQRGDERPRPKWRGPVHVLPCVIYAQDRSSVHHPARVQRQAAGLSAGQRIDVDVVEAGE